MNAPTFAHDKARIGRLIDIAARMHGDEWMFVADGAGQRIMVRRTSGEEATLCTIHSDALSDEIDIIVSAFDDVLLLLRTRERAAAVLHDQAQQLARREQEVRAKNYAAQAAILLDKRNFQRFLEGKGAGGPVRDKASADTRLKSILAIRSKTELNTDARAQAAWLQLFSLFEASQRAGEA